MVTVLATKHPEKTAGFMSYLNTIVKAQRTFAGEGWVTYDACYRRKAAITKWGEVDFTCLLLEELSPSPVAITA